MALDIKADDSVQDDETTLPDVRSTVQEEFGTDTWDVTEAALATHASLLIDNTECVGMIVVGPSGAGKTTVLRMFEGLDDQIYRSDDFTEASFVSAAVEKTEDELEDQDLLPKITGKTLLCRDMASLFSGGYEQVRGKMATLASVMDGEGYTRDSGTHGQRGYTGGHPFNLLGASTPLQPRVWNAMGHTGNRVVFHEYKGSQSAEDASESVFAPEAYDDGIGACRDAVHHLLSKTWDEFGGQGGVTWRTKPPETVRNHLTYLTKVIRYGRARLPDDGEDDATPQREAPERVMATLRDIARGRALLDSRQNVQQKDVGPCARIALSTMHRKRRPVVQLLLDPEQDGPLTAGDIAGVTDMSENTARKRMDTVARLGFGTVSERENDGRDVKELTLADEFAWPDELDYPRL